MAGGGGLANVFASPQRRVKKGQERVRLVVERPLRSFYKLSFEKHYRMKILKHKIKVMKTLT